MLTELCAELKNYFIPDYHNADKYIHLGTFTIEDGALQGIQFLKDGQYYRIVGSVFGDGVHKYGDAEDQLADETFDGAVWEMRVPPDVLKLAKDIEDWTAANADALASPYQSESYVAYSRTLKTGASGGSADGGAFGWQQQFANRLKPYRRQRVL